MLLLAPPVGALLAERWGVGVVFSAAGLALALLGAVALVLRPVVATPAAPEHAAARTSVA